MRKALRCATIVLAVVAACGRGPAERRAPVPLSRPRQVPQIERSGLPLSVHRPRARKISPTSRSAAASRNQEAFYVTSAWSPMPSSRLRCTAAQSSAASSKRAAVRSTFGSPGKASRRYAALLRRV